MKKKGEGGRACGSSAYNAHVNAGRSPLFNRVYTRTGNRSRRVATGSKSRVFILLSPYLLPASFPKHEIKQSGFSGRLPSGHDLRGGRALKSGVADSLLT